MYRHGPGDPALALLTMPEPPGPDDRLGLILEALWSKVGGGYRGALVGSGSGRLGMGMQPRATRDQRSGNGVRES